MNSQFLFVAKFNIGKDWVSGPVVAREDHSFIYTNTLGDYNLYMIIGKQSNRWRMIEGGSDIGNVEDYVDELGKQIEDYTFVDAYDAP